MEWSVSVLFLVVGELSEIVDPRTVPLSVNIRLGRRTANSKRLSATPHRDAESAPERGEAMMLPPD